MTKPGNKIHSHVIFPAYTVATISLDRHVKTLATHTKEMTYLLALGICIVASVPASLDRAYCILMLQCGPLVWLESQAVVTLCAVQRDFWTDRTGNFAPALCTRRD